VAVSDTRKVCFVVMGFGLKTDYETGRTLDLDATYEAIIKPAAEDAELRCIRADEIMHSGIIDTKMFEMLLRAELVIADISTGNANALYELGVRHALRPASTIIMKEEAGRLYFDLDHSNTFQYGHLGQDIGAREAKRARSALKELIVGVMSAALVDSPVYTFLPWLQMPLLTDEQYQDLLAETEATAQQLSNLIKAGEQAKRSDQHKVAADAFAAALAIKPNDSYLLQQLALNHYKAQQPSTLSALIEARTMLESLRPSESNDPETLGITGAIHKRIFLQTSDVTQLNLAINFYRRGFEIRRDYYNGENLATCLDLRAQTQTDVREAVYDRMFAGKVRRALLDLLLPLVEMPSFEDRSDQKWIYATLANASFALGLDEDALRHEANFIAQGPAAWEIETYQTGKVTVIGLRELDIPSTTSPEAH
jgi:tetratricopeptide (TPR) repeat protein